MYYRQIYPSDFGFRKSKELERVILNQNQSLSYQVDPEELHDHKTYGDKVQKYGKRIGLAPVLTWLGEDTLILDSTSESTLLVESQMAIVLSASHEAVHNLFPKEVRQNMMQNTARHLEFIKQRASTYLKTEERESVEEVESTKRLGKTKQNYAVANWAALKSLHTSELLKYAANKNDILLK